MNAEEAGQYWNENAEAWTTLARAGFDIYRDYLNTPAFFEILPTVKGLLGIDIGCGEGHNTRLLAQQGAQLKAVDISETFIKKANDAERDSPVGITYNIASATELPFENAYFDFVVGVSATKSSSFPILLQTHSVYQRCNAALQHRCTL